MATPLLLDAVLDECPLRDACPDGSVMDAAAWAAVAADASLAKLCYTTSTRIGILMERNVCPPCLEHWRQVLECVHRDGQMQAFFVERVGDAADHDRGMALMRKELAQVPDETTRVKSMKAWLRKLGEHVHTAVVASLGPDGDCLAPP
jgi:hypothetical protein